MLLKLMKTNKTKFSSNYFESVCFCFFPSFFIHQFILIKVGASGVIYVRDEFFQSIPNLGSFKKTLFIIAMTSELISKARLVRNSSHNYSHLYKFCFFGFFQFIIISFLLDL